jgi:hypothetical protein
MNGRSARRSSRRASTDKATWTTRCFSVFVTQLISVALHLMADGEISRACGVRGRCGGWSRVWTCVPAAAAPRTM